MSLRISYGKNDIKDMEFYDYMTRMILNSTLFNDCLPYYSLKFSSYKNKNSIILKRRGEKNTRNILEAFVHFATVGLPMQNYCKRIYFSAIKFFNIQNTIIQFAHWWICATNNLNIISANPEFLEWCVTARSAKIGLQLKYCMSTVWKFLT